jgi:hypothetical protein
MVVQGAHYRGLGGYKLAVAISKGRYKIMFLTLMDIISPATLISMRPSANERTGQ